MRVFLAILFCAAAMRAEPVPATNRIDWATVSGVQNWTNMTTVYVTRAAGTALSTIASDMAAAPHNNVVELESGTFSGAGMTLNQNTMGVTLRGQGNTGGSKTTIDLTGTITIGESAGYTRSSININSGSTRGSTTVTLASAPSTIDIGQHIWITELNNTNYVHPYGYEEAVTAPLLCSYCDDPGGGARVRGQAVRVTAIDGADVTFTPALWSDFTYDTPRIEYVPNGNTVKPRYVGFEGIEFLLPSSARGIYVSGAHNILFTNCTFVVRADDNPGFFGDFSEHVDIRSCDFVGTTSNSSLLQSQVLTANWRMENNWFDKAYQGWVRVGRQSGHAFIFNYLASSTNSTTALISPDISHGAHPEFILIEGNKGIKLHEDSIHGSASNVGIHRNHYTGEIPGYTTYGHGAISIDSLQSYNWLVGNVLGYSGMSGFIVEKDAANGDSDSTKSLLTWNFSGFRDADVGEWSKDRLVANTGNYNYVDNEMVWDGGGAQTLTKSYVYGDTAPPYAGILADTYPWIGGDVAGISNVTPAEYRFLNGSNPPAEGGGSGGGASDVNVTELRIGTIEVAP